METKEVMEDCQNCANHVQPMVGNSDIWPEKCKSCMVWTDGEEGGEWGHIELVNWEPATWAARATSEEAVAAASGAVKMDNGKPPMSLVPYGPVSQVAEVFAFGAKKYAAHNWRKGMKWSRLIDAIERHIGEFKSGNNEDLESGLSHIAHAATNCLFLLQYLRDYPELDDRYKKAAPPH